MWERFLPTLKIYLEAQVLVLIVAFGLMVILEMGPFQKPDRGIQAYEDGDYATALTEFRHAASLGETNAQFHLGVMYENGQGVKQDFAEAAEWYRLAAKWRHAYAQFNLGLMYYNGRGVEQDYAEAEQLFRLVAERGFADAQFNLGIMNVLGQGMAENPTKAYMWIHIAAQEGHEVAKQTRNRLENDLTPEQIQKGQDLAEQCRQNDYKNC